MPILKALELHPIETVSKNLTTEPQDNKITKICNNIVLGKTQNTSTQNFIFTEITK